MSGNVASASDEFPSINPKSASLGLLAGGGEMGERTRSFDWAGSAIGPVERWPHSLKTAVSICLGSRHPMVVWWDCHTNIQFYNDAYISFLGHAKHPMYLGRSARECWSEIWPIIEPMLAGVYETGEATWSEDLQLVLNRHLPREEGYFTFSYSAIRADDGSVGGIFCACNETTTRVIGERRLRTLRDLNRVEAEAKTVKAACEVASQILAENPGDIPFALVYLLNEEGTTAELMAATALEFDSTFAPGSIRLGSTQSGTTWPLEKVLESGTSQLISDLPARFGCLPGGLWPEPSEAALMVPIAAPGQTRPAGFLVAGISPRRIVDADYRSFLELVAAHIGTSIVNARAYDQERKRAEALAEIDRAKTAFFSNVSHEFRTPLTLMLGPVEEAAANPEVPRPVRSQLELAHRNSLRLLKLVNSLLDFSRIEAGRVQASFEPTDLGALTSDLASAFRSAMEHAGLSLTVECDELGEPVYIDREMWEKIALNLLSNAFKFTLHGAVTVRLHRAGSDAVLEIQDTGVGVPEHELPRLFERFHRVEGTVGRTQEGSGIGLALVQELVRLHGGRIDAQSELGHGSTFRVQIPLGKAHLPAARIQAARSLSTTSIGPHAFVQEALRWIPEKADESSSRLPDIIERPSSRIEHRFARSAGARIILADDNADMRAYVRDLLCPAYSVEAVADGEEALIAARRERPNLILCDIMMPRIDGLTLLKNLRADDALRDVPVILLSARAGEEARLEGLDTGADDFLVKPFSARELVARVGALLELTRMRFENEQLLREREQQLRLATEAAEVGLWDVDMISDALFWPPRVKAMFGISPEVKVSMADFYSGLHPDDREHTSEAFEAALDPVRRALYDVDYRTVGKEDGLIRWVAAKGRGIFDASGRCVRVIGTAIDITSRKLVEERLRRREADLEAADRQKDEFLAMLAHELRNPLASISNASELLSRLVRSGPRTELPLTLLKRQTKQLTRLVDDLLDISRIARGRIALEEEPVEIGTIIAQAVETVQPLIREKNHRFVLAAAQSPMYVCGDSARLVQAILNVLHNAVKYTERHGEIHLRVLDSESEIVIEIRDNGAGISPELLPHVFDLFVQSERTLDRSQGGLGIGLSVVKRLIEMHQGAVSAESEGVGHGSIFKILLPRIPPPPQNTTGKIASVRAPARRILLVDDNPDAADSLAMLLRLDGHEVHTAYGAIEALKAADRLKPEMIFLDIGLPEMDGYEVARRLRMNNGHDPLRLVALTGYGQDEDRARSHAAGFDDHLVKPVNSQALEQIFALPSQRGN